MTITWPAIRSAIAASALWVAAAFNVVVFVVDVSQRRYDAAAFHSLTLVALSAAAVVFPKLYARLDAQLAAAIAQQATAETILQEIQRVAQKGGFQVGVAGEVTAARTH